MNSTDDLYRRQADFLLRENMNKLKGLIDLLSLGILDTMSETEKSEFIQKIRVNMDSLYQKLESSISSEA
jgi:hypothetical protein